MVLEPALASQFIRGYTMLLLEIGGTDHQDQVLLYRLAAARILLVNNPKLLDLAVESLIQRSVEVDAQVVAALRSLRLKSGCTCVTSVRTRCLSMTKWMRLSPCPA
jgi:hypothetical protein